MIKDTDSIDPIVLQCARDQVVDRYRIIKRMMTKFDINDDALLRRLRKKSVRELGIPYIFGYLFDWSKRKVKKASQKRHNR